MISAVSQGYQDALAGRNNANSSPDYVKGWLTGFRERMLVWNSFSQPADTAAIAASLAAAMRDAKRGDA